MRKLGIKVGIVTNGQRDLQHAVIEALNFKQLVDAVIVSEEVDFQKPQKQIFEVVLQELHVEAKISHNG